MHDSLQQIAKEYLKQEEELGNKIYHQLALYIYSLESPNSDLYMLAKLLKEDDLIRLISYYDGDVIRLPKKDNYKDCALTALCFYLKEIKGWSWEKIHTYLDLPENSKDLLSSISIGGKINKVKEVLGNELLKAIDKNGDQNFKEFYEKLNMKIQEKDFE